MKHIRAAINFRDLALERGRQSTRSSPEVCLQKASENLTRISRHFLETRGSPGKPGRLRLVFTSDGVGVGVVLGVIRELMT